jgi:ribosome maturation factor RimP
MISAEFIRDCLKDELARRDLFLVEVAVRPVNRIVVYLDSIKGITLDECLAVNRFLDSRLDRNMEDFEVEVSSPGLDKPLKLPVQYEKNTGRLLDVIRSDGSKITGKLQGISGDVIHLETEVVIKDTETGKKKAETRMHEIRLEEIKTAKVVISLKKVRNKHGKP